MTPRISIPDEIRQALHDRPTQGVSVEDDQTHSQYVLLPHATYERVESLFFDASEPEPSEFLPLAHEAFAEAWDAPGMEAYDDYDRHRSPAS